MMINIGAPIIDVIAPTGIVIPFINTRDNISQINKNDAPNNDEPIIINLWSLPIIFLIICGITNPTKPMIPTRDTTTAVNSDANSNEMNLNTFRFIPKVAALESPNKIALYRYEKIKKNTIEITVITRIIKLSW